MAALSFAATLVGADTVAVSASAKALAANIVDLAIFVIFIVFPFGF
jgi:hypothetical protein